MSSSVLIVRIDRQGDDLRPTSRPLSEHPRGLKRDVARALGEEHKAHHVRASGERGFQRGGSERPQILTVCLIGASFGQSVGSVKGLPACPAA